MDLIKEFYGKLDYDLIKISRNENPIQMDLFLSFLTVDVNKIKDHLGSDTGWTKYNNQDINLTIGGGWVGGIEYLDSIRYKKDLHNPYNNWVTPFNMFEILTKEGQEFFFEYYKDNIKDICKQIDENIKNLQEKIKQKKEVKFKIHEEISKLKKF